VKASVQDASLASIQEPIANDVTAHIDRFPGVSFCDPLEKLISLAHLLFSEFRREAAAEDNVCVCVCVCVHIHTHTQTHIHVHAYHIFCFFCGPCQKNDLGSLGSGSAA